MNPPSALKEVNPRTHLKVKEHEKRQRNKKNIRQEFHHVNFHSHCLSLMGLFKKPTYQINHVIGSGELKRKLGNRDATKSHQEPPVHRAVSSGTVSLSVSCFDRHISNTNCSTKCIMTAQLYTAQIILITLTISVTTSLTRLSLSLSLMHIIYSCLLWTDQGQCLIPHSL